MSTGVQITLLDEDDPTVLYVRYDRQLEPQKCFVSLDLHDGELRADYEVGNAVPESVWHRRVLRWDIPCLTATAANEFLHDAAPVAQCILDGAEIEWNGSNNVGRLTEAAGKAEDAMSDLCRSLFEHPCPLATVVEYSASDWYAEGEPPAVTADMTDDDIAALATRIRDEQAGDRTCQTVTGNARDHIVLYGLEAYLTGLRDQARDAAL